jgi:hypothetical protein
VPVGADPGPGDLHVWFAMLPAHLRAEDEGADLVPYLSAPHRAVADGVRMDGALTVGLVWGGADRGAKIELRAVGVKLVDALADVPGVRLYSLQWAAGRRNSAPAAPRRVSRTWRRTSTTSPTRRR